MNNKYIYIIFDLSEVIITGFWGVEKVLSKKLNRNYKDIDKYLMSEYFEELMRGNINEDEYWDKVLNESKWNISKKEIKLITRENLNKEISGTKEIITNLKSNYKLILLSDHVREWIMHILKNNNFLNIFDKRYFSYELGSLKSDKITFENILNDLNVNAKNVLFIDDVKNNVDIANLVGIDGIIFENAEQLEKELIDRKVL